SARGRGRRRHRLCPAGRTIRAAMTADIAVEIRTLEPTTTIAVRRETTVDRLSEIFDTEMPRIGAVLSDVGGQMAGAPFARYHHYGPDRVDVEVGAPIAFVTAGL